MNLPDLSLLVVNVPTVIAAIYAAGKYPRFSNEFRVFSGFVFLSLVVQLTSQVLFEYSVNNLPLLHFHVPLGFIFLSIFYQKVFKSFIHKNVLSWIMIGFVLFSILNTLFFQNLYTFNSYALSLESVILTIYSLSFFILLLDESVQLEKKKWLSSLKWINSGVFIYYASGLLLFYFGELLTKFTTINFRISWIFHSCIHMIFYVCIIIGLWKHPKN